MLLLIVTIVGSVGLWLSSSTYPFETAFDEMLFWGPYPKELPAGHHLLFDGHVYSSVGPDHTGAWENSKDKAFADPCKAVDQAWGMREYIIKRIREKKERKIVEEPEPVVHWEIVTKPSTGNWCDAGKE